MTSLVSVIASTYNPHPGRLARPLEGLRAQSMQLSLWGLFVIKNAATRFTVPPKQLDACLTALCAGLPPTARTIR